MRELLEYALEDIDFEGGAVEVLLVQRQGAQHFVVGAGHDAVEVLDDVLGLAEALYFFVLFAEDEGDGVDGGVEPGLVRF